MAGKFEWQLFTDPEGMPWALFAFGVHDPVAMAADDGGRRDAAPYDDEIGEITPDRIAVHWIIEETDDEDGDPDHPWMFCDPDTPGAEVITGVRFT